MAPDLARDFQNFERAVNKLSAFEELTTSQIARKSADAEALSEKSGLYRQCSEVFKSWLETLLDKNVNSMADLVTSGLSHIIDDQDLKFRIKQEMKYNKISMAFLMEADGHSGDPMDSYGGGTVHVSSFILRLAIMARLSMANLLILDEPLNALARQYIPNCGAFIRQLSEKTGINILMVTHNQDFLNYAHTSYEGRLERMNDKDGHAVHRFKLDSYSAGHSP